MTKCQQLPPYSGKINLSAILIDQPIKSNYPCMCNGYFFGVQRMVVEMRAFCFCLPFNIICVPPTFPLPTDTNVPKTSHICYL